MIEFYQEIRWVHVSAITLSGIWMALRGACLLAGMKWPRGVLAWSVSLAIDGVVLTAASMLLTMFPAEAFANHWLTVKLALVAIYFLCGYGLFLMQAGRVRQIMLLAAAMAAYLLAYGVARAHDPLGWLRLWGL
ncbi:MAG: SirB2 family protein [Parvularculaceae bacterium]|nr:SirB2 family protein [Parvularculaceae bacterium]